jgi:hypothetical protein
MSIRNGFQRAAVLAAEAVGHPELIRIGPGNRLGPHGVTIDPRRIQLTVLDARAVGTLAWLLLHRQIDGDILWYPTGTFVRLEAQGSLFPAAQYGSTVLTERLKVLDQWLRCWSASVVAEQEIPELPPDLVEIGRDLVEEAILEISWTRERRLLIGDPPAGPFSVTIPPRAQLVRCRGTAGEVDQQEGAIVHGIKHLTELANAVGTACFIDSEHVAPGIGAGTKVSLIRTHGPHTKRWQKAAGLVRLTSAPGREKIRG